MLEILLVTGLVLFALVALAYTVVMAVMATSWLQERAAPAKPGR